jgi:hypothetical protein
MGAYYFVYCTWLDDEELRKYAPNARLVTKARAANHKLGFFAAGDRSDRGWCHFSNGPDARDFDTLGLVYEIPDEEAHPDYDDFDRCFVTVHGEDGGHYDCYTYRLTTPGVPMRPPNYYWDHIPKGLADWDFPEEYVAKVLAIYHAAAECPRADRPVPSASPGKSAASR